MRGSLLCVAMAAVAGCAPTELTPATFPAQYLTQGNEFESVPACASFRSVTAVDARADASAGKRFLEDQPQKAYPISMNGDVAGMLTEAASRAFAALKNDQAKAELKLGLVSLVIDEKASRNSMYDAMLVVEARVINAPTKQVSWQTRKSGHGRNYGESGSTANYQETVSRALEEALGAFLKDQQFARALCHPDSPPAGDDTPSAPPPSL